MTEGFLIVNVYADNMTQPIKGAQVKINNSIFTTNDLGQTSIINLPTVSKDNSLQITNDPYKTYNIEVTMNGMTSVIIKDIEIFDSITSRQNVFMTAKDITGKELEEITIPKIVLNGDYSSKYNNPTNNISTYVLKEVVIPEYIIIHDGNPSDTNAAQYYVTFSDYIKNVACSEIYSTWPKECLKANILAIISFTLNRIFTEWYPSKGYSFTVTSVTAYDQKYTHNRTIFDSIAQTVDEVILNYIKRPNRDEPLLAQYCDGEKLKNEGWLWQWGSKDLATQGNNYEQILKFYYGNDIEIKTSKYTTGLPTSFPGYDLSIGMCGSEIKKFQDEINIIRGNYPGLIQITNPNGEFNSNTKESVIKFQNVFGLKETGIVDYSTWYKISYMYLAVKRMIFGVYDRQ